MDLDQWSPGLIQRRKVFIMECDHMFQTEEIDPSATASSWDSGQVQHRQKNLFRDKIAEVLRQNPDVSLIAEEAAENQQTFALEAAKRREISYANINLFKREQLERGFPENYLMLPEAQQTPFHRTREEYFLDRTIANLPDNGAVLFICGRLHAERMALMFQGKGYEAALITLTVDEGFKWDWFIEPFEGF